MQIEHMRQSVTYASSTCPHKCIDICTYILRMYCVQFYHSELTGRYSATQESDSKANTHLYSPHFKARYPVAVQAAFYRPVRGDIDLIFAIIYVHTCHLTGGHHGHRVALLRSQHNMTLFRSGDKTCESVKQAFICLPNRYRHAHRDR